jgi:hypothetical protein
MIRAPVVVERNVVVRVADNAYRIITAAVQGPPGVGGATAYVHHQPTPSTEWIINHNLGYYPDVTVLSTGLAEVDAEVVHISVNQTRVYFVVPFAGIARCE